MAEHQVVPHQAQTSAAQNSRMMVAPIVRPVGDGGVSTIAEGERTRPGPDQGRAEDQASTRFTIQPEWIALGLFVAGIASLLIGASFPYLKHLAIGLTYVTA
jgi:hypothetical protein